MERNRVLLLEKLPFNKVTKSLFYKKGVSYDFIVDSNFHYVFCGISKDKNYSKSAILFFAIPSDLIYSKEKEGEIGWHWTLNNSIKTFSGEYRDTLGKVIGRRLDLRVGRDVMKMKGQIMSIVLFHLGNVKDEIDIEKLRELSENTRNLMIANLSSKDVLRHKKINP